MRERFIKLVEEGALPFAHVCARFGISRKTGYKWLSRFREEGAKGLLERDRVPRFHPHRTGAEIEALVCAIHAAEPKWKGGSIRTVLRDRGIEPLPAVTTIDAICRRCDQAREAHTAGPDRRAAPNDTWQLTVGPASPSAGLNHLAIILRDVATDFVLAAEVVAERGEEGCREMLWRAFARQGLPRRLRWPVAAAPRELAHHSPLTVAVLKLGVGVEFSVIPPEKDLPAGPVFWPDLNSRLRGTGDGGEVRARLQAAIRPGAATVQQPRLARGPNESLPGWRGRLAAWADHHNVPTSAAAGLGAPATRYRPSPRCLPEATAVAIRPVGSGAEFRRVSEKGIVHLGGHRWVIGRAFAGEEVTLRTLPGEEGVVVDYRGWPLGLARTDVSVSQDLWAQRLEPIASG